MEKRFCRVARRIGLSCCTVVMGGLKSRVRDLKLYDDLVNLY